MISKVTASSGQIVLLIPEVIVNESIDGSLNTVTVTVFDVSSQEVPLCCDINTLRYAVVEARLEMERLTEFDEGIGFQVPPPNDSHR